MMPTVSVESMLFKANVHSAINVATMYLLFIYKDTFE